MPIPRKNVLSALSAPYDQYCEKKIGKNAAITVVANALFAQSYRDHEMISFLESFILQTLHVKGK